MGDTLIISRDSRSARCPFLSLPGELRNHIYDFCAEEGDVHLPASRTRFGNLRYVCKLFRTEFTPFYLSKTAVTLQPADVERYFAAFYPDLQSRDRTAPNMPIDSTWVSEIRGRIRIDLPIGATVDLSFFANLRRSSSKMQIIIVSGRSLNRSLEDASELLQAIVEPACSIDYQETVERILFRYSVNSEIVIKLHRGVSFEELSDITPDRNPRQWLIQQGLPTLRNLKIVMESSEGVLQYPVEMKVARPRCARRYLQLYPLHEPGASILPSTSLTAKSPGYLLTRP